MDLSSFTDEAVSQASNSQSLPTSDLASFTDQAVSAVSGGEQDGAFVAGVKAGTQETAGLARAAAGTVQSALGFDTAARSSYAHAQQDMAEAEVHNKQHIASPFDIKFDSGYGQLGNDVADFILFNVGKQVPNIAMVAASAFTGGLGTAAVVGAEAAAKDVLFTAGKTAVTKKMAGQIAGGFAASTMLETGAIGQEQHDIGVDNPAVALIGGALAGALEFLPMYNLARMFGLGPAFRDTLMKNIASSNLLTRIAGFGAVHALSEGATEDLQEVVDVTAREVVDRNYDMLGPEARRRILEAGITGAAVGAPFGGAAGVFHRRGVSPDPEQAGKDIADDFAAKNPTAVVDWNDASASAESLDQAAAAIMEAVGPPGEVVGSARDTQPPAKTRIPTLTIVGESGLEPSDSQAIQERNVYREHVAEYNARNVPEEQRTPAQAMLVKIKDRERAADRAQLNAAATQDPSIIVGPIAESRADAGLIIPGGVADTRTDNVQFVIAPSYRTRAEVSVEAGQNPAPLVADKAELSTSSVDAGQVDSNVRFGVNIDPTRLTAIEQKQLDKLEEKESLDGLSEKEYERLSYLLDKGQGVDLSLPDAGKAALEAEVNSSFAAKPIDDFVKELMQMLSEDGTLSSRVDNTDEGSFRGYDTTAEDVKAVLEKIALPGGPRVEIHSTADTLPPGPVKAAGSKRGTRAVYVPDTRTAYFIANRHKDAKSIATAYLHEALGHHGLRAILSPGEYKKFVELMYKSVPRERMQALAKLYELSTSNPHDRAELAEEAFSIFAEENPKARLVDRAVALVREFLRKIFPNLKFSDAELKVLVADIRRYLSAPLGRTQAGGLNATQQYASRLEELQGNEKYTTRVLEALPKKTWLNADHVAQALKATNAKSSEVEVFREVLALPWMGRQFLAADLRAEVLKRIANLTPSFSEQFADYGLERIGVVDRDSQNAVELTELQAEDVDNGHSTLYRLLTSGSQKVPTQLASNIVDGMREFVDSWLMNTADMDSSEDLYKLAHLMEEQYNLAQGLLSSPAVRGKLILGDLTAANVVKHVENINLAMGAILRTIRSQSLRESYQARATVWEAPFQTSVELIPDRHYDSPYYMAHTRSFVRDGVRHVIEIQSDLYQKISERSLRADIEVGSQEQNLIEARNAKTIFNQIIREEIRLAIENGETVIRFPTAETAAAVNSAAEFAPDTSVFEISEGTAGAKAVTGPEARWQAQWDRYKDFLKIYREFGATSVEDFNGWSWWEIETKFYKGDPVKVFASRIEQAASALGVDEPTQKSLAQLKSVLGAKMAGMFLTPLQIAKVYAIEPVNEYIKQVQNWWTTKTKLIEEFDRVAVELASNKERAQALSRAVFEVSSESDRVERRLDPITEILPILKKYDVDKFDRGIELFWEIDASFVKLLDRLERGLKYNAIVQTLEDPNKARAFLDKWQNFTEAQKAQLSAEAVANPKDDRFELIPRLNVIEKDIQKLRSRNYFPRKRFGQYTVSVRASSDTVVFDHPFKQGQLILFETHESRSAQLARIKELEEIKALGGHKFDMGHLSDQEFQFLGMPPTLMQTIRKDLQLSPAQQERLKEIEIAFSPGRAFLRHLLRRKGIRGYSEDLIRVYSAYGMSAANHIARMEHHLDMSAALNSLKELKGPVEGAVQDSTAVNTLFNYFTKHYDYILNPENDWAKLRAFGFMWYLGFNVKSAIVNTTQIPLTLYPYLADRYGDGKATREIAKALKDAVTIFRKEPGQRGPKISNALNAMIERGKQEGFIDESLATELAGFTESNVLERMLPISNSGKLASNVAYYGSWMFRQAEKYSRIASFIAATRLAEISGVTDSEAIFQAGKEAVQTTMFEYSKWNRPQFMRGKKSVVFLFWNWMQHASFLAAGGAGRGTAVRFWIMLLLAGGLQGLPFAEDIMNILGAAGTKIRELLGLKAVHVDPKRTLLEFAQDDLGQYLGLLKDQPDLLTHGLARYYGLGPLSALAALGAPIPYVDISGSVSMGRFLPGVEELLSNERDSDAKFGKAVAAALGPVAGVPYNLWKASESSDPDVWKKWERVMPTVVKSLSKATRLGSRGEETFRGGGQVAQYDIHDTETRVALLAQAFGFSQTKLSQKYDLQGIKNDMREYFLTKRAMLLEDYAYAKSKKDREGEADAIKAVKDFNESVPEGGGALRISSSTLKESIKQRNRRAVLRSRGIPNEPGLRQAYREVDQLLPGAGGPR